MQSHPNLHLRLRNCDIATAGEGCELYMEEARTLMQGPGNANLDALAQCGLVFVPMPEDSLFEYAHKLFARWAGNFTTGIIVIDDPWSLSGTADPQTGKCWYVNFASVYDFENAGMCGGRYFMWLDRPSVFVVNDFDEFSGIACPLDLVPELFGNPFRSVLSEFEEYAEKCTVDEGRDHYRKLARHYARQAPL